MYAYIYIKSGLVRRHIQRASKILIRLNKQPRENPHETPPYRPAGSPAIMYGQWWAVVRAVVRAHQSSPLRTQKQQIGTCSAQQRRANGERRESPDDTGHRCGSGLKRSGIDSRVFGQGSARTGTRSGSDCLSP